MTLHTVAPSTTITVPNHKTLVQVWRNYGIAAQQLIGRVVVTTPLTPRQTRRLPAHLRSLVSEM